MCKLGYACLSSQMFTIIFSNITIIVRIYNILSSFISIFQFKVGLFRRGLSQIIWMSSIDYIFIPCQKPSILGTWEKSLITQHKTQEFLPQNWSLHLPPGLGTQASLGFTIARCYQPNSIYIFTEFSLATEGILCLSGFWSDSSLLYISLKSVINMFNVTHNK